MKSFASTYNESQNMYGSSKASSSQYENTFDINRIKSVNLNKSVPVIQEMLKPQNINISNFNAYPSVHTISNPGDNIENNEEQSNYGKVFYENPLELPSDIIALAKDYEWIYKCNVKELLNTAKKSKDSLNVNIANTIISPSMFNPMYGVSVYGIIRNTPLLNDSTDENLDSKITDCSIRTLCALSKNANSSLGQARYKYADFMYCKDLGKISNNHLITLRKFAHPVGDHIFEMTAPKYVNSAGDYSFQSESDIGRLVTWFGTDDNRLEDICKYSYSASWKFLEAGIEENDSPADKETSGIIGFLQNSVNPVYNDAVFKGQAGSHNIWSWLGTEITQSTKTLNGIGENNGLLRNYDNHKVYTPINTIQSTHIYEGKLEFSQEFTLNFSYKLRAYENINPRSALLDLIGNILEVTYRRGKFFGGERRIIGPPQELAPFEKTSKFIDNAFDKMGGLFGSIINGGEESQKILGSITSSIKSIGIDALKGFAEKLLEGGMMQNIKGQIKNVLGRPTLYAWQSFLSGDDVGLWHVTIGNPRNPIMVMGNLIMTNSTIQHSGPLGIDDFPSELKVSITLKHARPRDITEIGRMYTKGAAAIYHVLAHHNLNDFFGTKQGYNVDKNGKLHNKDNNLSQEYNRNGEAKSSKHLENLNMQSTGNTVSNDENILNSYKNDIKSYATENNFYDKPPIESSGYPNPFLESDEHVKITRTNNWSDTMFSLSLQEAA